ncbi:MAG: D-alanyl-D-alanine carboxypeptidase [Treponema sp.]|jgi:D-alanyl-D-alanine carboxypeptidase (penicillin-binding protein 5/6)|nr:D-alanyl-D-alanine carboxypeptidase [Treponema sp.]
MKTTKPGIGKIILFSLFFFVSLPVFTQVSQYFYTSELLEAVITEAPELNSHSVILIDAASGALLYAKNTTEEIPPASLTKLMTMHLVMKEIEEGRAFYDEFIPITTESWAQSQPRGSSLMFLAPGQNVTLHEILLGLAISSGNDAAAALALRLAPTIEDFADLMNIEARRMGLYFTRFVEASGISELNMTTADEFAWFCRQYIMLHPNSLSDYHSVQVFAYPLEHNVADRYKRNPRTITQNNRNHLLESFPGVDGLKTGYIEESGYNIALTAERDGTRFIAVALKAESSRHRDRDGRTLLTWAFDNYKTVRPVIGKLENPRLWKGKENKIDVRLAYSPVFTSPLNRADNVMYECYFPEAISAPLAERTIVGQLIMYDNLGELHRIPLVSARTYEKGNIFKRLWHSIRLLFLKKP